jgi:hypothetical protein
MRSLFGVVGLGTQLGTSIMARLARRDEAGCSLCSSLLASPLLARLARRDEAGCPLCSLERCAWCRAPFASP